MRRPIQTYLNAVQALTASGRRLLAALVLFALVTSISALRGKAIAAAELIPDKLLRFAASGFLSGLLYCGLRGSRVSRTLPILVLIGLPGALDETLQWLMPYRNANPSDWKFDMLAAMSCAAFLTLTDSTESRKDS